MISYAQNAEDVLLARFFTDEPPSTYIDVGAGHPTYHSVTKYFYDNHWSGLNVEPRSGLFQLFQEQRPRDVNLNCLVATQSGTADFFEVRVLEDQSQDNGGLSTMDGRLAASYRERGFDVAEFQKEVRSLQDICEQHNFMEIGFLKVDVEGAELDVVRSLDLTRWRPRVIVAESTRPLSPEQCDEHLMQHIVSFDYEATFFDGLNRYYVRSEDAKLAYRLRVPANVFDNYITFATYQLQAENKSIDSLLSKNAELQAACHHWHETSQRRTLRGRIRQLRDFFFHANKKAA